MPRPSESATVRAASGTPGGSTPPTRSTRSASSGVNAETIEMSPASVAAHARATGAAGRRMPPRYRRPVNDPLVMQEDAPELVLLARLENGQHLVTDLELGLLVGDLRLSRAHDRDQPCPL